MEKVEVVVIDDNEGILWLLQELLDSENIFHKVAKTGAGGIDLIVRYRPRLAIVDIKLGIVTGLEVARRIKDISPDTKILFITGETSGLENLVNENLPVVGIMEKPFEVADLLKLLRSELD